MPRQSGQRGRAQWQPGRDLVQGRQIQAVGLQLAMRRTGRIPGGVQQPHVPAWPTQSLRRLEAQPGSGKLQTPGDEFSGKASRDAGQLQRRQTRLQPQRHIGQRHISSRRHHLRTLYIDPSPQRTTSLVQIDTEIDVALELRHLDVGERRKSLTGPFAPAAILHGQEGLFETRSQAKALAPFGGRCCIQTRFVAPSAVAQHQVHIAQRNGWGSALLVSPQHGAMANDKLGLRENVVEHAVVRLPAAGEIQPRNIDFPFRRAPDIESRCIHIQLVELQRQQRLRRKRQQHARKAQGLAPLGVGQADVGQLERRDHSGGVRTDRFDPYRHSKSTRREALQLRTQLADSRHNQQVQDAPGYCQQEPCRE